MDVPAIVPALFSRSSSVGWTVSATVASATSTTSVVVVVAVAVVGLCACIRVGRSPLAGPCKVSTSDRFMLHVALGDGDPSSGAMSNCWGSVICLKKASVEIDSSQRMEPPRLVMKSGVLMILGDSRCSSMYTRCAWMASSHLSPNTSFRNVCQRNTYSCNFSWVVGIGGGLDSRRSASDPVS